MVISFRNPGKASHAQWKKHPSELKNSTCSAGCKQPSSFLHAKLEAVDTPKLYIVGKSKLGMPEAGV